MPAGWDKILGCFLDAEFEGVRGVYALSSGIEGPNRSNFAKIWFVSSVLITSSKISYDNTYLM